MKHKRIASLKIFGETWKVVESDQIPEELCGLCDFDNKELVMRAGLSKEEFKLTLIHELGHAICYSFGLHLTRIPTEVEEILVESYAKALTQNFKALSRLMR